MADKIVKVVSWIITNAEIVAGVKEPKGDQAIFKITGMVKRSDSKEPQKGPFVWTPNKKAAGYSLDLSGFNLETGKGKIVVNGSIGKNGRKGAKPLAGDALAKYADLAVAKPTVETPEAKPTA